MAERPCDPRSVASERARKFWNTAFGSIEGDGGGDPESREDVRAGECSEWLIPYSRFRDLFRSCCRPDIGKRLLVIGCGLSHLTLDLYDDGFDSILSTDISDVAVERMRNYDGGKRPGITWEVADVFGMPNVPSGAFDAVVDKATLDSVLFRQPNKDRKSLAALAAAEIARVLKPDGVYFVITPRRRFRHLLPGLETWQRIVFEELTADDSHIVQKQNGAERSSVYIQAFRRS